MVLEGNWTLKFLVAPLPDMQEDAAAKMGSILFSFLPFN